MRKIVFFVLVLVFLAPASDAFSIEAFNFAKVIGVDTRYWLCSAVSGEEQIILFQYNEGDEFRAGDYFGKRERNSWGEGAVEIAIINRADGSIRAIRAIRVLKTFWDKAEAATYLRAVQEQCAKGWPVNY